MLPERYDLVISTIPIGTMTRLIGRPTAVAPKTMRLISLCYRFSGDLGFSKGIILLPTYTDSNNTAIASLEMAWELGAKYGCAGQ